MPYNTKKRTIQIKTVTFMSNGSMAQLLRATEYTALTNIVDFVVNPLTKVAV